MCVRVCDHEQLLQDIRKAIETMNPVYSVREDGANLEISFPKYVSASMCSYMATGL